MALRGGPAEPGDTSGDLVGARLPADKREPGSAGHCDMAKGAAVEPLEAEIVVGGDQPVPASLLLDAANGPDTHLVQAGDPGLCLSIGVQN